jgi:hypothetical protein
MFHILHSYIDRQKIPEKKIQATFFSVLKEVGGTEVSPVRRRLKPAATEPPRAAGWGTHLPPSQAWQAFSFPSAT